MQQMNPMQSLVGILDTSLQLRTLGLSSFNNIEDRTSTLMVRIPGLKTFKALIPGHNARMTHAKCTQNTYSMHTSWLLYILLLIYCYWPTVRASFVHHILNLHVLICSKSKHNMQVIHTIHSVWIENLSNLYSYFKKVGNNF